MIRVGCSGKKQSYLVNFRVCYKVNYLSSNRDRERGRDREIEIETGDIDT